jgi:hypothetical protein
MIDASILTRLRCRPSRRARARTQPLYVAQLLAKGNDAI